MSAGLQTLKVQLKAVSNIKKLTSSMKSVSSSRLLRAQKHLKIARVLGEGCNRFFKATNIEVDQEKLRVLIIAATSDRGLCGSVHSRVCRMVTRLALKHHRNAEIVCLGEKAKNILKMDLLEFICLIVNGVGIRDPIFLDASRIANRILRKENYMFGKLVFCKYQSLVSFKMTVAKLYTPPLVINAREVTPYDLDIDDALSFLEFSTAVILYHALCENYATELAFRVNVMSNAVKNANTMLSSLQIRFNKSRQTIVTNELIDIISGALYISK